MFSGAREWSPAKRVENGTANKPFIAANMPLLRITELHQQSTVNRVQAAVPL